MLYLMRHRKHECEVPWLSQLKELGDVFQFLKLLSKASIVSLYCDSYRLIP